jgi:hypothetical protein
MEVDVARQAPIVLVAQPLPSGGDVAGVHLEWQISFGDAQADRPLKTRVRGPSKFIREFSVTTDSHFSTDVVGLPANADIDFRICSVYQDGIELCSSTRVHTQGSPGGGGGGPISAPSAPKITAMTSRQFTLHESSSLFISWSSENCDIYHLSWRVVRSVPGSVNISNVQEIRTSGTTTFTARIVNSLPGEVYETQVQACRHVDIGADPCSPFSPVSRLTIPDNTKSLRQFLSLSGVSVPTTLKSLGFVGPGFTIRGLLRV